MRIVKLTMTALCAVIAGTAAAAALEVKQRGEVPGTPAEVWAKIGGFCAIQDWHPAVAKCEETKEGDDVFRILTLQDGAAIKEKLTDSDDMSYSYEIIEGPLPVKDYEATFEVEAGDETGRSTVVWEADFDANGVEDAEAEKIIQGIFADGIASIEKQAGG